jgi:hypothetical protein
MNKFIIFAAIGIIFMSCSKKSTPTPAPTQNTPSIIGKWYVATDTVSEFRNGVLVQSDTTSSNHTSYTQFNDDNTGVIYSVLSTANFTYTKSGNVITASIPQHASDGTIEPPLVETFTIKKITENSLLLGTNVIFNYGSVVYTETGTEGFVK